MDVCEDAGCAGPLRPQSFVGRDRTFPGLEDPAGASPPGSRCPLKSCPPLLSWLPVG